MEKKSDANTAKWDGMKAGIDMMKMQQEAQEKMAKAQTDEERAQITNDLQDKAVAIMLRVLWTTTTVDITAAIQDTTRMVFHDQSVSKEVRKSRVKAVKQLGMIWMETPEPETDTAKDAKKLYEEAAFNAMLETVKRKDEAAHHSG